MQLTKDSLIFLPETPRYLIKMDRYDKAAKSLGQLRRLPVDHPAIIEELNEVQANHLYEMSLGKSTYLDCFKGTLGKRLLTGCLLQSLQQLTGVNFICKYRNINVSNQTQMLTPYSLLRNTILQERGFPKALHHPNHHQRREHRLHLPRSLHGRETWPSQPAPSRRYWHVRVPIHRSYHRNRGWQHGSACSARRHCVRVHIHLLLRLFLGPRCVGRNWRIVPA
jgi:hypothetical protein